MLNINEMLKVNLIQKWKLQKAKFQDKYKNYIGQTLCANCKSTKKY